MAKYDQGGGCSCGLYRECECESQTQADGSRTHEGEIFVFGSNMAGRHGKGAALTAYKVYGAILGQGSGRQGNSYAIPTKNDRLKTLPLLTIKNYVDEFIWYAAFNPQLNFFVTAIGCGLAGYSVEQIAPMFIKISDNVRLNDQFKSFLDRKVKTLNELKEMFE